MIRRESVLFTPSRGLRLDGEETNVAVDAEDTPDDTGWAGFGGVYMCGDGSYALFEALAKGNLMPPEVRQPDSNVSYLLRKDIETGRSTWHPTGAPRRRHGWTTASSATAFTGSSATTGTPCCTRPCTRPRARRPSC
ncbi:hypothetical protein GCM10009550_71340 [Actinocorallia libanotica]|uniref:Uncharacterized protein n=1 Tax=Actinocorallia libanotica TaxID=46162 RepID=A0ABN1RYD7_9ACTN